jgi:type 1 fimbria pilin
MKKTATITCTIAGRIWMPSCLCWKDGVKLEFGTGPWKFEGNLRDAACQITNDGDFQSCAIVDGSLKLTRTKREGSSIITRTRYFDLEFFPSIADCIADEKAKQEYEDALCGYSDDDDAEDYG